MAAVRYAREQRIPFLGICLGLQCAVIEFARNVCELDGANSSEFNPATPYAVIDLLPEQKNVTDMGASMRLGAQACYLVPGTKAAAAYGEDVVEERHRHRWEVNPAYHRDPGVQRPGPVGQLAEGAAHRDHRAARTTRSSWRASSTRSCGPAPRARIRCSWRSSAPRRRYARDRGRRAVGLRRRLSLDAGTPGRFHGVRGGGLPRRRRGLGRRPVRGRSPITAGAAAVLPLTPDGRRGARAAVPPAGPSGAHRDPGRTARRRGRGRA